MGVERRGKGFLRTIPASVRGELRSAIRKGASQIVSVQKALVTVDDGDLKDSITYRMGDEKGVPYAALKAGGVTEQNDDLAAVISAGNSKVRYAHLVEFGTRPHVQGGIFKDANPPVLHPGTQPKPFFLTGYKLARGPVKKQLQAAIKAGVDKVVGKG